VTIDITVLLAIIRPHRMHNVNMASSCRRSKFRGLFQTACLSLCWAKTDEPTEMPFGGELLRTCRNMCEIELHIGASLQARLNDPCELSRVHSR